MQYESARLQIASLAQSFDASGLCCRGNCGAKIFVESRLDFRGPLFFTREGFKKFRVDCLLWTRETSSTKICLHVSAQLRAYAYTKFQNMT